MKIDVTSELLEIIEEYEIILLVAFGSRAIGEENKDSDLDLAIYTKKNLTYDSFKDLKGKIDIYFREYEVDLVNLNENENVILRVEIFGKGKCIFEKKEGIFEDFQFRTWDDSIQMQDWVEEYIESVNTSIQSM